MLGKTHGVVGVASALAVMNHATAPELVIGISAAMIGSMISDVDAKEAKARSGVTQTVLVTIFAVALSVIAEKVFGIHVYDMIMTNNSLYQLLFGVAVFLMISIFGAMQPHRSFAHSLLAGVAFTASVYLIAPTAVPYFAIGFGTHLLLDLLNFKGEQLLYPLKKTYSLKVCNSSGVVNDLLFAFGTVAMLFLLYRTPTVQALIAKALDVIHSMGI